MTQIAEVYNIQVDANGVPQPLVVTSPGNQDFSVWKAVVIANNSGFVGQIAGVADTLVDAPAIQPLTQDVFPFNRIRGPMRITWPAGGAIPIPPTLTATFTDDPARDLAGKSYPSPLATTAVVSVSDLYNPVPIQTSGGGGGGGLLQYAYFGTAHAETSPVTWVSAPPGDSGFAYLDGANQELIALPADSITQIKWAIYSPSAGITDMALALQSGVSVFGVPARLNLTPDSIADASCTGWIDLDPADLPGGFSFPAVWNGTTSAGAIVGTLSLLSWAKP
jgi:hypothetical protein